MSAIGHVFGTVEMLELVLLNLEFRDLSRCFRVCRYFQATINGSRALMALLWSLPGSRNAERSIDDIIWNPENHDRHSLHLLPDIHRFITLSLHPVLRPLFRKSTQYDHIHRRAKSATIVKKASKKAFLRLCDIDPLPSSWKNMAAMKSICRQGDHFEICMQCCRCGAEAYLSQFDMEESLHDVLSGFRFRFQSLQKVGCDSVKDEEEQPYKHKWDMDLCWRRVSDGF